MKFVISIAWVFASLLLLLSGLSAAAEECPIIVPAYDGGHYNSDGQVYADTYHNYSVGKYANLEFRNFFAFQIPILTQGIDRAELRLNAFYIDTADPFETYQLHAISTSITELTNRTGLPRLPIFNDLGDGPAYASFNVSTNSRWMTIAIPLNSTAISAITAASGSDFALGGRVTTFSSVAGATELLFDSSVGPPQYYGVTIAIFPDPPLPPQVTMIWGSGEFPAGTNVLLSAETCGHGPFTFQWQHEGTNLVGATNTNLPLLNVKPTDAGAYRMIVSDPYGTSTSSPVLVTVVPLRIDRQPISLYVLADDPFALAVDVTSLYPVVSYQWYRASSGMMVGETNSVFSKQHAVTGDSGSYYVIVSNSIGSVTSYVASVSVAEFAPYFSVYQQSNSVPVGGTVTIAEIVNGAPRPSLQWYFRDEHFNYGPVPGANGPELTLVNVTPNDAGTYFLLASNRLGSQLTTVIVKVTVPGALDQWRLRNPFPQPNDLHDIAFGNGQFVAVGEHGAVVTSTNGVNWVLRTSKTGKALQGLTFGNDRFVAIGANSAVVSTNGVDWRSAFPGDFPPNAVTFGAGKFVAVGGYTSYALVSTDGFVWQPVFVPYYPPNFNDIVYANGLFIAVGGGAIAISPDALNWSRPNPPFFNNLEAINFLNGAFWTVGAGGLIASSVDGTNWVQRTSPVTRRLHDIAYGNGVFVTVGVRGTIVRSTDGASWTEVNSGTPDRLEAVVFANNIFVAAGESGTTLISSNGLNWIEESAGFRRDWDGITDGDNLVMAVGKSGMTLTTSNGVDLVLRNVGTSFDLHGVSFAGGKYVAVGDSGVVGTSTDAVNWQVGSVGTNLNMKTVAYGNGLYVTVGVAGTIFTSADALSWYPQLSGTIFDINSIAFGDGQFVAVGDDFYQGKNGRVLTSPDGTNWLSQRLYSGKFPRAVTYANNRFAIVGNDGYLSFSTNGINWDVRYTGIYLDGDNLRGITFNQGLWVIVGNNGIILSSRDTIKWQRHYSPVVVNFHGVRLLNGRALVVGNAGVVLHSELIYSHLSGAMRSAGFELTFHPGFGDSFRIESSSNLSNWSDLTTLNSPFDPTILVDPSATTNNAKFYRSASP